jgi:hypothetical protein
MALTVTLLQLRTWVRQRAHIENGGHCDDAEINDLINAGIRKLHRLLTQAFGPEYFKKSAALATVANTKTVALPADFYKLISLWWDDGSEVLKRMRRATEEEIERQWEGQGWTPWARGMRMEWDSWPKYAVRAATIEFVPTPTAVHQLTLNYSPPATKLILDADTLDGYNGFEEFVAWDATAEVLAKEESDPSYAIRQVDLLTLDIAATADRDQSEPTCIQDTVGWEGER